MNLRDLIPQRGGRVLRGELVEVLASAPSTSSPRSKPVEMANGKEATATGPAEREPAPENDADDGGAFAAMYATIRADLAESATWRGRTPSLEEHWHDDPCAGIPTEYRALRFLRLAYHRTFGVALVAVGAAIAFVGARPWRFVIAAGLIYVAVRTF